ncbi:hypothetical protein ACSBR2_017929 [Camellia fascicularis]
MCPSMYRKVNSQGDISLHIAAREGHSTIIRALIKYENALDEELEDGVGTTIDMMRMRNEVKDTASHEAVRNHHPIAVQLLTQKDLEFCHPANNAKETPLYLAADIDGRGQNILHIAVKNQKKRAIKFILQNFPLSSLINQKDVDGNTPLHLLAASDCYEAGLVKHLKVDMMTFNDASLTPLDVVCSKNVEP